MLTHTKDRWRLRLTLTPPSTPQQRPASDSPLSVALLPPAGGCLHVRGGLHGGAVPDGTAEGVRPHPRPGDPHRRRQEGGREDQPGRESHPAQHPPAGTQRPDLVPPALRSRSERKDSIRVFTRSEEGVHTRIRSEGI